MINKKPKISVITPTYNHERYIKRCVNSVLQQTFNDWEMIIVDDKSTDKTYDICKDFAYKDPRIKVVRHKSNFGVKRLYKTNNQALRFAKGEYVAILEGDDFWPKDKLEKQYKLMKRTNAVLSFGDCVLTDESGLPINLYSYDKDNNNLKNTPVGTILKLFQDLSFAIIPVTVLIEKKALKSLGGFRTDKYYPFTDIPTFLALSLKGKFAYSDSISGYYRKQRSSEWYNFASKTNAMGRSEITLTVNEFIKKNSRNLPGVNLKDSKVVYEKQKKYIEMKKRFRHISRILNNIAFRIKPNPLFFLFIFKYLNYLVKKIIDA